MKSPRTAARRRHARPVVLKAVPELLVDGRPSVYSDGQGPAAVKGLTLHPESTLEQLIDLQRRIGETAARDKTLRAAQGRARRLRWLTAITVLLWLAALVAMLLYR